MNKNFLDSLIGRPNTLKTQKCLYGKRIEPYTANAEPTLMWIEKMAQMWIEEGLKPGTVKQLISLARRWIQWKWKVDISCRHLVSKVGRLADNRELPVWSKEESKKALNAARHLDTKLYNMMLFTLHTGLRKSEMFALTHRDIDLFNEKLLIRNSKTGRPRSIPMTLDVENLLQMCYIVGGNGYVFPKTEINGRLKKICEYAEIPLLTWHGLRHTFATLALESGQSPKLVSSVLGHSSVSTTLDIYWNLLGNDLDMSFVP